MFRLDTLRGIVLVLLDVCSVSDPDSVGSVDPDSEPDPDPGGQKMTHKNDPQKLKFFYKFHVLKCWMFSFKD